MRILLSKTADCGDQNGSAMQRQCETVKDSHFREFDKYVRLLREEFEPRINGMPSLDNINNAMKEALKIWGEAVNEELDSIKTQVKQNNVCGTFLPG